MNKTGKLLISGAAGFIGSNLVRELVKLGHRVTGVDNLSNGHREFLDGVQYEHITSSFDDYKLLKRVRKGEFDAIFHLAAIPRVSYSVENPQETWNVNVTSTIKLVEAARIGGSRFIFSSSSSVYGGADVLPTPPSTSKNPQSPYALQKSITEEVLSQYVMHYDMDAVALRYFNVFGPHQLGGSAYATAISSWLACIKEGRLLRRDGDGGQTRDMCYVDNVVSANVLAMKREGRFTGERYNVATGLAVSNNEILKYLADRFNFDVVDAPVRAGDVKHTLADISATQADLGYQPLVMFWEGLERTISWYMSSPLTALKCGM